MLHINLVALCLAHLRCTLNDHYYNFKHNSHFSYNLLLPCEDLDIVVLLPGKSHGRRSLVGCSPWGREGLDTTEQLHFHFHFHALEKEMATHFSVLAWRIPGVGEPDGLPSMGLHRVGHD